MNSNDDKVVDSYNIVDLVVGLKRHDKAFFDDLAEFVKVPNPAHPWSPPWGGSVKGDLFNGAVRFFAGKHFNGSEVNARTVHRYFTEAIRNHYTYWMDERCSWNQKA